MKKRLLSLLLASVMVISLLAGCGKTPSTDDPATDTQKATERLRRRPQRVRKN